MNNMNFTRPPGAVTAAQKNAEETALIELLDLSLVQYNEKKTADRYAGRPKSLGAGRVGHPMAPVPYERGCERAIWYEMKQYPSEKPFPGKLYRTFSIGHAAEDIIAHNLECAGFTILRFKPNPDGTLSEEQYGFALAFDENGNPRYKGFFDGVVINGPAQIKSAAGDVVDLKYPFLWENKSANNKKFEKFAAEGVEKSHPNYYGQVQTYMNFGNLFTNPAMLTMLNKDTGEVRPEFIRYNVRHCQAILDRVARILDARGPLQLERGAVNYESLPCKWCEYKGQCAKDEHERTGMTASIAPNAQIPGEAPSWLKKEG